MTPKDITQLGHWLNVTALDLFMMASRKMRGKTDDVNAIYAQYKRDGLVPPFVANYIREYLYTSFLLRGGKK